MTHHSTSVNMKKALSRERRGFTLVEMVVVVAIVIALMAIMLPALKGLRGSKQSFATTQFIGDLSTARLMAMNRNSKVYVVFMPLWTNSVKMADEADTARNADLNLNITNSVPIARDEYFKNEGNPYLGGQLISYAFYADSDPSDSLGSPSKRWLSDWKQLPEGAYFPSAMLDMLREDNNITFPHFYNDDASSRKDLELELPYIGFDEQGRVFGIDPDPAGDAVIRLVEGGVLPPEKRSNGNYFYPENAWSDEPSNIGRTENYVLIDYLTGRARTTVMKTVPADKKWVTIKIIRFTERSWRIPTDPPSVSPNYRGAMRFKQYLTRYADKCTSKPTIHQWGGEYSLIEGQWQLKSGAKAPVAISKITARRAGDLQIELLRKDPDAELLIE
jgi:type II secretory pathway pseudopilin PulG